MVGADEIKGRLYPHACACAVALAMIAIIAQLHLAAAQDAAPAAPAPQTCTKAQFEGVVDEAAEALRNLNQEKKPEFEDRLRQLKEKRGWSHEEFLKAAAPFVKDDAIDVFDTKSNALLEKLSASGDSGASAKTPDCATLLELHEQMKVLVETQNAKWVYMFGKLDGELQK